MKLFQQMLLAPAALGLMAPMAANAADLNIQGVSDYAATGEQVTSITQFSDVYPTDWAYQALSNLIERYGCVAGYPSGSYKGNRAMTRYEAAALLNACLDRVTEVTDELRRLLKEFETELSVLRGRVDGLEARVGELEATQFSTTTKLVGQTTMVIGANSFGGDGKQGSIDLAHQTNAASVMKNAGALGEDRADAAAASSGGTVFNYDLRLDLNTSFTGKDLLKTRLRAGNFENSPFGGSQYVGLDAMEVAFGDAGDGSDEVEINRLWYQFPLGNDFTVTAGAKVRQDDMLAVWPSAYPADTVLDFFTYAGAPGAYSLTLGGGGGIWWENNGWSISASYVSSNADDGNPNTGGLGTDGAASNGTAQIAYADEQWGIAAAYSYTSGDNGAGLYAGNATPSAAFIATTGTSNSFAVSAWLSPEENGWFPSISAGWGINRVTPNDAFDDIIDSATSQSWYAGLQWEDAFVEGNVLGAAVGQPTFLTDIEYDAVLHNSDFVADGNYAFELWYKFQVTDNISVTPAAFYLSRPYGDLTNGQKSGNAHGGTFSNFGGLVKTTFKF